MTRLTRTTRQMAFTVLHLLGHLRSRMKIMEYWNRSMAMSWQGSATFQDADEHGFPHRCVVI